LHAIEHGFAARYPLLLGHEGAGEIDAVGEGVEEVIRQLAAETDLTLALVGGHSVAELDRSWIAG
ncbi:MAG TPA: alcohol dehydrogenase catalytic domain-containing protein, partial [Gaiellaceae bacterium]